MDADKLADKLTALLHGAAQGATANWGDEGAARLLSLLPLPKDPDGIKREYAAGSPTQDYENTMRGEDAELARKYPDTFMSGRALGAAPMMVSGMEAMPASIPAAGLFGGLRGAVVGAGAADDGNRAHGAAGGALPAALMAMSGVAAPQVAKTVSDYFKGGPPSGPTPAFATAGAPAAVEEVEAPVINRMATVPAGRGGGRPMGSLPKADEEIIKEDQQRWEINNPNEANKQPNVGRPAILPPKPDVPEPDVTIPKQLRTPQLGKTYQDIARFDDAAQRQAQRVNQNMTELEKLKAEMGIRNRNLNDPRDAPEFDPTYRQMEDEINNDLRPTRQMNITPKSVSELNQRVTPQGPEVDKHTIAVGPGEVAEKQTSVKDMLGPIPGVQTRRALDAMKESEDFSSF